MIRLGVIGTNWITERFLEAAKHVEDFSLTAVYSRTEEKAKEFAGKYGVHTIFTNLEEMAESDEIDAVYIASPNSHHSRQAVLFLENKKHVLCEKPLASNAAEVKEMIEAAQQNEVLLMEAMKSTVMPNFESIKKNISKIGTIRRFSGSYCQYSSRYDAYKKGTVLNAFNPEFSSGALMDLGIYVIYPLVVLFGKPNKIQATGTLLESGADGQGSILLSYDEMEAVVMYSKITESNQPSEIQGEHGSIIINKISGPEAVDIHYREGSRESISVKQDMPSMYYEAKEFVELIHQGKIESDKNSFTNSLLTIEIMDEARKQIGIIFPADH
ncbi:Gfo/Idh/MocA family protein [Peribacillus butanolivorans]|uniref:Gfo/Idh/MocA family oxidoreductase n=1 Tax=Peribacillus butanolivorans TaxID=421767 RepID=A0ABM6XX69_9BACI|nr:Gfo/Idh/MocA family oxidoreductase [Peribacillus butanolivorans]AXN41851.1 gfo/Idh/MocA family oxidoreductase [Peribacillus butanolivorans]